MTEFNDVRKPAKPRKGRGAVGNPAGRFEAYTRVEEFDGWHQDAAPRPLPTTLIPDRARTVINRNDSPDVPFELSINPYRGCEHGCVYCYARPTHAYLGLSPGLDFETQLFYKPDTAKLLQDELRKPGYRCSPITLGANTDAYQPAEKRLEITRSILQVLSDCDHPVTIVTKSALVERDLDILTPMADRDLVQVLFSFTTLDSSLSRRLEPRPAAPQRRLQALQRTSEVGVPTGVLVAPIIPGLTDAELERILEASREAGAESAGYVVLRLPLEVEGLFQEWLAHHQPLKARRVMSLVRQFHGGQAYDSTFGRRMRGTGSFSELLSRRFALACTRLGLNKKHLELDCSRFASPIRPGDQLSLF